MRTISRRLVLVAVAASAAAWGTSQTTWAGGGAECAPPANADAKLAVHEWGTFTSMQGDGVALEGLGHEEESLPGFVYSRSKVRDCPLRAQGYKGLEVPAARVTQKMETPVIYFHSAQPRQVRVRVDFTKGLLTQWYPVSDLLGPPEGACDSGPLDVSKVASSFLEWDVNVLGDGAAAPQTLQDIDTSDPWHIAREVAASYVQTAPRTGPNRLGPIESERYLFYRGLGAFDAGLTATAAPGGTVSVVNRTGSRVGRMFLLQVDRDRARFGPVPALDDGKSASATLSAAWDPADVIARKLEQGLQPWLVAEGLRADEASAMVRTWARSWFRCEGMRILWVLPRAKVDAMLPLAIDPKPDELVRVLVGRLEIIPPETLAEVSAAIRDRASQDPAVSSGAQARLDRLGRFLEPHVRNVLAQSKDAPTLESAKLLLAQILHDAERK